MAQAFQFQEPEMSMEMDSMTYSSVYMMRIQEVVLLEQPI